MKFRLSKGTIVLGVINHRQFQYSTIDGWQRLIHSWAMYVRSWRKADHQNKHGSYLMLKGALLEQRPDLIDLGLFESGLFDIRIQHL